MNFFYETLRLGLSNLMLHKLRSFLTAMGIIFGVAAVIMMVAIGEGNKRKVLSDIARLGSKNIILRSIAPTESTNMSEGNERLNSYGLLRRDLRRLEQTVGPISEIIPLKRVGSQVFNGVHKVPAAIFGTTPRLCGAMSLQVARGRYISDADLQRVDNVAVVGHEVAKRLFPLADPLGNVFRVDDQTYTVIGVLSPIGLAGGAGSALVGRDLNFDIHIPMPAAILRFGDVRRHVSSGTWQLSQVEVSEVVVQVPTEDDVMPVAQQIERVLEQEHAELQDATTIVPLELLNQAERTQRMFNALMISIASISLLVGGIGIMNIMLASVTERTREIGIRRALGATRRHIIAQFLVETTVLSGIGGFIGIAVGLGGVAALALVHQVITAVERPQVTLWSVIVSFLVATAVGIVFGLYPAVQAARQDPIVALRHD